MTGLRKGLLVTLSFGATGARGKPEDPQVIALPDPVRSSACSVEQALEGRRSVRAYAPEPLPLSAIGQLAWAAQGVTEAATRFHAAPSAGATFPLKVDLLVYGAAELDDGIYRYLPGEHALTRRLAGDSRRAVYEAAFQQAAVLGVPVLMLVSAVMARTAAHYGSRAERYVHMEAGHATQNVALQAVALGVGSVVIGTFDDAALTAAMHLSEGEQPLCLVPLGRLP